MEAVKASIMYGGLDHDVLVLAREPLRADWEADPVDVCLHLWRVVDEKGEETGEIYAIEIVGFSQFRGWEDLPEFPPVKIGDMPAMLLVEALKEFQSKVLRQEQKA